MPELKTKFGIRTNKMSKRMWEFGIVLQHSYEETFLVIQLGFIGVGIGKFYDLDDLDFEEFGEIWQ